MIDFLTLCHCNIHFHINNYFVVFSSLSNKSVFFTFFKLLFNHNIVQLPSKFYVLLQIYWNTQLALYYPGLSTYKIETNNLLTYLLKS